MKKISTLFKKNPENLGLVLNEIDPKNMWVFDEGVRATRKFDGSACAIIDAQLYKRYDAKKGKVIPEGAIPCQEADEITGHHPHWIKCDRYIPEDKYFFEGYDNLFPYQYDGTYELCGPKVNGNKEKLTHHLLFKHGEYGAGLTKIDFDTIKQYLLDNDVEGIVFHHPDGMMCKIRKSDFEIKR